MSLHLLDHPLLAHKISHLRDVRTRTKEFRELAKEMAMLMAYEATKDLETEDVEVQTPLALAKGRRLSKRGLVVVPILRAGLGMVDSMLGILPNACVGHLGLYRDEESLEPQAYYVKLPADISRREVILVDPMLATGGSASQALTYLADQGVKKVRFMCLVAAQEGVDKVLADHPQVDIYTAALDPGLNEDAYILPGLGDAGDRLFGTEED